ncbi:MAG: potassium channel family protein [Acidobacteriota bacterium]
MRPLIRSFHRFRENPSSIRYAAMAIIASIVTLVFVGALLIQVFSPNQFSDYWEALWFSLQTVTTVGYGDITPTSWVGRFVASIVMLVSIGLLTVIYAAVTSLFIRSYNREQDEIDRATTRDALARLEAALAAAHERLERIEQAAIGQNSNDA